MGAKKKRVIIKMVSTESSHFYTTERARNPMSSGKLEYMKYDPTLRRHVLYREAKIG